MNPSLQPAVSAVNCNISSDFQDSLSDLLFRHRWFLMSFSIKCLCRANQLQGRRASLLNSRGTQYPRLIMRHQVNVQNLRIFAWFSFYILASYGAPCTRNQTPQECLSAMLISQSLKSYVNGYYLSQIFASKFEKELAIESYDKPTFPECYYTIQSRSKILLTTINIKMTSY